LQLEVRPEGPHPDDLPFDDLPALVAAQRPERHGPPELLAVLSAAAHGRGAARLDRPDERQRDGVRRPAPGVAGDPDPRPRRRELVLPDGLREAGRRERLRVRAERRRLPRPEPPPPELPGYSRENEFRCSKRALRGYEAYGRGEDPGAVPPGLRPQRLGARDEVRDEPRDEGGVEGQARRVRGRR